MKNKKPDIEKRLLALDREMKNRGYSVVVGEDNVRTYYGYRAAIIFTPDIDNHNLHLDIQNKGKNFKRITDACEIIFRYYRT